MVLTKLLKGKQFILKTAKMSVTLLKKSDTIDNFNIKPFEELPISTITTMVYCNISIDQNSMFCSIPITNIEIPLTKKKKNIDKKKITAPYGSIVSLQHGIYFRGFRSSKKKKYWCPMCQIYDKNDREVLTIEESESQIDYEELNYFPTDTKKILFHCNVCTKYYKITDLCKIIPFLNQVTIVLSLGNLLVNVMMFKDSFKIAGGKCRTDPYETMMILWEDYINPIQKNTNNSLLVKNEVGMEYEMDTPRWKFRTDLGIVYKDVHFLFDPVMMNVSFSLGFPIDKSELNIFMNRYEYRNEIFLSHCEQTSSTHVNIKMPSTKPVDHTYNVMCYKNSKFSNPSFLKFNDKIYNHKSPEEKQTTIIVFSSAKIILTGRYAYNMKEDYNFFVSTALKNKDSIAETVIRPKMSLLEYLSMNTTVKET